MKGEKGKFSTTTNALGERGAMRLFHHWRLQKDRILQGFKLTKRRGKDAVWNLPEWRG